jgi:signal transduction histidine kinase
MHSQRTEAAAPAQQGAASEPRRARLGDPFAWLRRLNVRLTLMLAGVAVLALLVSAVALYQILPSYFLEQAVQRANTAAAATAILVQRAVDANESQSAVRETRDTDLIAPSAQFSADRLSFGSVSIFYPDGSLAARAEPSESRRDELSAQGLSPDTDVEVRLRVRLQLPANLPVDLIYVVSSPYNDREVTLARVRDALIGSGLVALLVSILLGIFGARLLTRPIARVRRAANRFAHGQLDSRAPPSNVLEVDELAQSFNVMADRLSESLRLLEADRDRLREFVADVSHELRTPIAALRTFTELQRDTDLADEQRQEFLDRSTQQINRLEWMSNNLLDLSRIDAGIFPLDMHWGDLRDPVRSVVEAHSEQAAARGLSLVFEVPGDPVMLSFDRERIVQLLSNLVGNALKFTPRGGEIVAELVAHPDAAIIEVRDSGPGIPEADLPLVFDRFFRGTNVGEARASGSGLGLAIARSIVEMHGGTISVSSVVGEGATFTIRLPRRPQLPSEGQRQGQ